MAEKQKGAVCRRGQAHEVALLYKNPLSQELILFFKEQENYSFPRAVPPYLNHLLVGSTF
jgi:hypothetical protein